VRSFLLSAGAICCLGLSGREASATAPFTLVALPDTQYYSANAPQIFAAQTQWVVANKSTLNIAFVTHLGDIVDDGSSTTQWNNALPAMNLLDGNVPYSVCFGNHDLHWDYPSGDGYTKALTYFGPSRYQSYSWFGGASSTGLDTYQVFSAGGYQFLHLNLRYNPDSSDLAWAQTVIGGHSSLPTILSTHAYLNTSGARDSIGSTIWGTLVKSNSQIFLTINGHYSGESQLISTDDAGRKVIQMVCDYQSYRNNGAGFLRELVFDPDASAIYVKTYSPTLGYFETDAASQFAYSVTFGSKITVNGLLASPVYSGTWAAATANWNVAGSWLPAAVPANGSTTKLTFGGTSSYTSTDDVPGNFTVNQLNFSNSGAISLKTSGFATGVTLDGSAAAISLVGSGAVSIAAPILFAADSTISVSPGAGQLSLQAGDSITGGGNVTFANSSSRPVLMGNAGAFTGNIRLAVGAVKLSNTGGDALGNSTVLAVDAGTSFDFSGNGENLGGLQGAGNIVTNGANLTFFAAGNRTFSGTISGGGKVTQAGGGLLVLSGSSTYTGGTAVTAGTIAASGSASLGTGLITLNGGTLRCDSGFTRNGSLSIGTSAGVLNTNGFDLTLTGRVSGSGSLTKQGAGSLILSGSNNFSGGLTVVLGSVVVTSINSLPSGIPLTVGGSLLFFDSTVPSAIPALAQHSTSTVPEPPTSVLLAAATTCMLLCRSLSRRTVAFRPAQVVLLLWSDRRRLLQGPSVSGKPTKR
jgi:autotransporter-associated beta strand protein